MTDYDKDQFHTARYGESNPSEIESSIWNRLKNACRIGNHWNVLNDLNDWNGLRLFDILGKTKANEVVTEAGVEPGPGRGTHALRFVEPGTTPHHALVALCQFFWLPSAAIQWGSFITFMITVLDPLPNIPTHVMEALRFQSI